MTKQEAIEKLEALHGDPEQSHLIADDTLINYLNEIGEFEVADAWIEAARREDFWYA